MFLLFVGIVLAVGILAVRYGADSRTGNRQI